MHWYKFCPSKIHEVLTSFNQESMACLHSTKNYKAKWMVKKTVWRNWTSIRTRVRCIKNGGFSTVQFSSITQSCLTLHDPKNCSMPGLPVHHQHPEFTQTHVHWVGDAIQPSHPMLYPSPPAFILSQNRAFSNESALPIRLPRYWSFSFNISPSNEHSGLISFQMDWFDLLASKGLSRVFSNTTVQMHQFFNAQCSL